MIATTSGIKVLCLSRNASCAESLARRIRLPGVLVMHAVDRQDGYATCLAENPDLVIIDHATYQVNGGALLRQLRQHSGPLRCPVVAVWREGASGTHDAVILKGSASDRSIDWNALHHVIEACTAGDDEIATEELPASALQVARTLLVVDDDGAARFALQSRFERDGYRVLGAASGEEALELAQRHHPHAIAMDLRLPGIDGLEVAVKLKSDQRTYDIPIIFLTGSEVDECFTETVRIVGGQYFLRKPIDPNLLVKTVNDVVDGNKPNASAARGL